MDTQQEINSSTRCVTYHKPKTTCASLLQEIQKTTQCSRTQLSTLTHISLSTLYRISGGITRKPSIKTCNRLLDIYCLLRNFQGGEPC